MRAVIQRVKEARVEVEGEVVGRIGEGMLILLGAGKDDSEEDARYLADKAIALRIFEDPEGKMNLSVRETGGEVLVVSQFTLYGDCRKGRRPSFDKAAPPELAEQLYELFVREIRERGVKVETGRFRAMMDVHLINRGPVTLMLDSKKEF
ncbi:MAG: D-tyrosyl-tRNA(Tyr) deacylase [Candidatus Dadabacteria bacterium RIFCSPHIGHO2_12_FULL_53_21]|nr:MAG: D-tyrosyl-tRNA(Tyr) deacylase [Candidatus Dadabacteria bacterium RIFCSPHIGHO2_12_FULL_53_21]